MSGSTSVPNSDGRDIVFVHAYIVYQLLSRRIQRDLLLVSALLSTSKTHDSAKDTPPVLTHKQEFVDSRLYPAIVKLLDTIIQSLDQMRTLSIVDDNPDLSSAVEARISFTKARRFVALIWIFSNAIYLSCIIFRCLYLAHCYTPVKKYAEALALVQHANIAIRETTSTLSMTDSDPISASTPCFFPLSDTDIKELESHLTSDGLQLKRDWFAFSGGSVDADIQTYRKPLFFNIALNYVELDMDRLMERAGRKPAVAPIRAQPMPEKKNVAKAKAEESRSATPEPQAPSRGGLTSLLGGWWGRS
jgi:signal recognition particle subunit SRP68